MNPKELKQLSDRLLILEGAATGMFHRNRLISSLPGLMFMLHSKSKFDQLKNSAIASVKEYATRTDTPLEKLQPSLDDFIDQLTFYYEYVKDIQTYITSNRLDLTDEEFHTLSKSPGIPFGTTTDLLGLINEKNRGLLLRVYQKQLTELLDVFKDHGVSI